MWNVSRHVRARDVVLILSVPPRLTVLGFTDNLHPCAPPPLTVLGFTDTPPPCPAADAAMSRQPPPTMQLVASALRIPSPPFSRPDHPATQLSIPFLSNAQHLYQRRARLAAVAVR